MDIQSLQQYSFPMGVSIGSNTQLSHTLPYKQHLLWKQVKGVQTWVPTDLNNPTAGSYISGPPEVTYGISLLVDEVKSTSLNYSLLLDESSHVFGTGASQYNWNVWSIHLTDDGRPLALVQINLTSNNLGTATFASRTLGGGGSGSAAPSVIELPSVQVPFGLPELGPIWALIDITTGQILANTAQPNVLIRPYYLYQCDLVEGSGHFRTPVGKGLEIIEGLRGHTSGYAVPTYVIDAPGVWQTPDHAEYLIH